MKPTIFLDSNIFIYALERNGSNCEKIIDLLTEDGFSAIISEKVFEEVVLYCKRYISSDFSGQVRRFLLDNCHIVLRNKIQSQIQTLKGKIKDRDLEHLATVKAFKLKYLVSYDRDYEGIEEYITPKKLVELFGLEPSKTEY